jgi:DNA invertase Pin-like site-specific DNA recombinase
LYQINTNLSNLNKMKAIYVRVSTPNQNLERQFKKDGRLFIDICSGSIPFMNRPGAIDLINAIDLGQVDSIQVNAVDRLGRNMNDILNTLKFFTDKGIDIHLENIGLHTMVDGKTNPTAQLVIAILGHIAEMERDNIKQRTKEGIAVARASGKYVPKGRPRGSKNGVVVMVKHFGKQIEFAKGMLAMGKSLNQVHKQLCQVDDLKIARGTLTKLKNEGLLDVDKAVEKKNRQTSNALNMNLN